MQEYLARQTSASVKTHILIKMFIPSVFCHTLFMKLFDDSCYLLREGSPT